MGNAHKRQGQKVNRLSRRDWGTWCPKVWQTDIIYLISCGISGRNIFLSVQFRVITSLCNIWCWTFIKFYPTGIKIQKHMQYPTAQSDRNGHGQRYVYAHTYRPLTRGHESNAVSEWYLCYPESTYTKLLRQWAALMSSGIRCEAHITNTMASYWSQCFSERFVTHRSIFCQADTGSLGPKWSQILSVTISFLLGAASSFVGIDCMVH